MATEERAPPLLDTTPAATAPIPLRAFAATHSLRMPRVTEMRERIRFLYSKAAEENDLYYVVSRQWWESVVVSQLDVHPDHFPALGDEITPLPSALTHKAPVFAAAQYAGPPLPEPDPHQSSLVHQVLSVYSSSEGDVSASPLTHMAAAGAGGPIVVLKAGIVEGVHFELLPAPVYSQLLEWCGSSRSPLYRPICRAMRRVGFLRQLQVELHPLVLSLHLVGPHGSPLSHRTLSLRPHGDAPTLPARQGGQGEEKEERLDEEDTVLVRLEMSRQASLSLVYPALHSLIPALEHLCGASPGAAVRYYVAVTNATNVTNATRPGLSRQDSHDASVSLPPASSSSALSLQSSPSMSSIRGLDVGGRTWAQLDFIHVKSPFFSNPLFTQSLDQGPDSTVHVLIEPQYLTSIVAEARLHSSPQTSLATSGPFLHVPVVRSLSSPSSPPFSSSPSSSSSSSPQPILPTSTATSSSETGSTIPSTLADPDSAPMSSTGSSCAPDNSSPSTATAQSTAPQWTWPCGPATAEALWSALRIGDVIDCRDSEGAWFEAQVRGVRPDGVAVHFLGWPTIWDEVIPFGSDKLAPRNMHTAATPSAPLPVVMATSGDLFAQSARSPSPLASDSPSAVSSPPSYASSPSSSSQSFSFLTSSNSSGFSDAASSHPVTLASSSSLTSPLYASTLLDDHVFSDTSSSSLSASSSPLASSSSFEALISSSSSSPSSSEGDFRVPPVPQTNPNRGIVGMQNLGNTCYLNSAVQCLAQTPRLAPFFVESRHVARLARSNTMGWAGRVADAWADLLGAVWSGHVAQVSPSVLKQVIAELQPRFAGTHQHDASELLSFLLDGLHEDMNSAARVPSITNVPTNAPLSRPSAPAPDPAPAPAVSSASTPIADASACPEPPVSSQASADTCSNQCCYGDSDADPVSSDSVLGAISWENYRQRHCSPVAEACHGQLRSVVTCGGCGWRSVTFDPFAMLSVPLPLDKSITLEVILLGPVSRPISATASPSSAYKSEEFVRANLPFASNAQIVHLRLSQESIGLDVRRAVADLFGQAPSLPSTSSTSSTSLHPDTFVPAVVRGRRLQRVLSDSCGVSSVAFDEAVIVWHCPDLAPATSDKDEETDVQTQVPTSTSTSAAACTSAARSESHASPTRLVVRHTRNNEPAALPSLISIPSLHLERTTVGALRAEINRSVVPLLSLSGGLTSSYSSAATATSCAAAGVGTRISAGAALQALVENSPALYSIFLTDAAGKYLLYEVDPLATDDDFVNLVQCSRRAAWIEEKERKDKDFKGFPSDASKSDIWPPNELSSEALLSASDAAETVTNAHSTPLSSPDASSPVSSPSSSSSSSSSSSLSPPPSLSSSSTTDAAGPAAPALAAPVALQVVWLRDDEVLARRMKLASTVAVAVTVIPQQGGEKEEEAKEERQEGLPRPKNQTNSAASDDTNGPNGAQGQRQEQQQQQQQQPSAYYYYASQTMRFFRRSLPAAFSSLIRSSWLTRIFGCGAKAKVTELVADTPWTLTDAVLTLHASAQLLDEDASVSAPVSPLAAVDGEQGCAETKHMKGYRTPTSTSTSTSTSSSSQSLASVTSECELADCLDEFSRVEVLDEDNTWTCPSCKRRCAGSTKKLDLWRLPDVLVVHIKRFIYNRRIKRKVDILVDFPVKDFDLSSWLPEGAPEAVAVSALPTQTNVSLKADCANDADEKEDSLSVVCPSQPIYDLYGVSQHAGVLGFGHYTAAVRNLITGQWFQISDSHVTALHDPNTVRDASAYVLFYAKRNVLRAPM